jgi:MFS family permease
MVAGTFVMLALNTGFGFYALGSFTSFFVDTTDISLTTAATGATVFLLWQGLGGILVARLLHRFGVRGVLLGGAALSATCLSLLGFCTEDWQLWPLYTLYGVGSAGIMMIPASAIVIQRFGHRRPARPLSIAAAGLSVGGAVVAPVVAVAIRHAGLEKVGPCMALTVLLVVLPLAMFAPPWPEPAEHLPDDVAVGDELGREPSRLMFVAVCAVFSLLIFSQSAVVTHLVTLGDERGIGSAATALSVLALCAVGGRIVGIVITPVMGLWWFSIAMAALQVASLVVFALAGNLPMLLVGAVLMGMTVGNNQVLIPLWVLQLFGVRRFPGMFAKAGLLTFAGPSMAPFVVGSVHALTGGYAVPMAMAATCSAVAGVIVVTALPSRAPGGALSRRAT